MRSQKGQIWSLDVVLAAVLFTLAMGLILSQTELNVFNSQQERNMRELHTMALAASSVLASSPEVLLTTSSGDRNIRCGPSENGWSYDYDLSWMPNCIVNIPGTLSPEALGLPPGYDVSVQEAGGTSLLFATSPVPADKPFSSVTRWMRVLSEDDHSIEFHDCFESLCSGFEYGVTVSVWRI